MIFYGNYDREINHRRVRARSLTQKDLSIHHAKEVTQSTGAVKWHRRKPGKLHSDEYKSSEPMKRRQSRRHQMARGGRDTVLQITECGPHRS